MYLTTSAASSSFASSIVSARLSFNQVDTSTPPCLRTTTNEHQLPLSLVPSLVSHSPIKDPKRRHLPCRARLNLPPPRHLPLLSKLPRPRPRLCRRPQRGLKFQRRQLEGDREDGIFLVGTLAPGLVDADQFRGREGVAEVEAWRGDIKDKGEELGGRDGAEGGGGGGES